MYWLQRGQAEWIGRQQTRTDFTSAIDLSVSRDPNQCGH